jgi:hypothetical protein
MKIFRCILIFFQLAILCLGSCLWKAPEFRYGPKEEIILERYAILEIPELVSNGGVGRALNLGL